MAYNILFYFTDQQRWDTCGCFGQPLDITPRLDELAGQGVKFDNAFSPQPVCGPCRALFQTGRYPTETGCFRNNIMLPKGVKTLADYIEQAGYETAISENGIWPAMVSLKSLRPSITPSPRSRASCAEAIPASGAPPTYWNSPLTATTAMYLMKTTTASISRAIALTASQTWRWNFLTRAIQANRFL